MAFNGVHVSDNKVQAEGLRRGHKDGSSSKLQQCVDHPLAQTTDDMKRITLSGEVLHNEEKPVASDTSLSSVRNIVPPERKADRSSSSSSDKMENHQVQQNNGITNENHEETPLSKEEENRAVRPSTLQPIRPKKKIKPNVGDFFKDEDLDGESGSPPGENMLGNIDDLQTPEDLDTPEEVDVEDLEEIDWESETPLESPSAIPEYTAEEERADSKHWKAVWIGDKQFRIDMKVVEPYKKVLSHGGYMGEDLNAIIVFSGCFLPDRGRKDYNYVMDNLFLYVTSTLEQLVAEDYMIVFFHGATPRRQMPGFSWLKRCYQMIDHRLKKNLKALLLVHPTLWLKTIVMMTRPFISSKFYSKLRYVKTLEELTKVVPMEHVYVPEQVKLVDHLMRMNPKTINEERSKRNSFTPTTPASLSTSH